MVAIAGIGARRVSSPLRLRVRAAWLGEAFIKPMHRNRADRLAAGSLRRIRQRPMSPIDAPP